MREATEEYLVLGAIQTIIATAVAGLLLAIVATANHFWPTAWDRLWFGLVALFWLKWTITAWIPERRAIAPPHI